MVGEMSREDRLSSASDMVSDVVYEVIEGIKNCARTQSWCLESSR